MLQIHTDDGLPNGSAPEIAELPRLPMVRDTEWQRPEFKHQRMVLLRELLAEVAAEFGFTVEQLRGRHVQRPLVIARREFCIRAWKREMFSATEIGKTIDRGHEVVMYHCDMLKRREPMWRRLQKMEPDK